MGKQLSYYATLALIKTISYLPFWMIYLISDILYYPFYYGLRYRRKIVRKNLSECFPQKTEKEIKCIERRFYRFFVDMSLEACKLSSISFEDMKRRMRFEGIEHVNRLLEEGYSISTFMGHYGNWEWVTSSGLWFYKGAQVAQIYRKLENKSIDRIMRDMRQRMGNKCVEMHETVRYMADAQSSPTPHIIGFIADQSPKRRESKHFIKFLNHNIPVLTGTEKATKHYGYKAVFLSVRRLKRGYYTCKFTELHGNPQELPDFELTRLFFNRLEQEIQEQPEMYLWTHNRFKYAQR